MYLRAFLGVLALALMMTVTLVSPTCAGTVEVFDVAFTTGFGNGFFQDVLGEFVAQFDPSQSIHSSATIISLSHSQSGSFPTPLTGVFDYAEEPIPQSPTNATRFVLNLTVQFGTIGFNEGIFTVRTFGYDLINPIINCLGAQSQGTENRIPVGEPLVATSCQSRLVSETAAEVVPLPPGFVLFGSGLLGLAGWRRFRKS